MPIFRHEFQLSERPVSAWLRIAGLGQWDGCLDGVPLFAAAGLHGSWTDYRKRVSYRTVDLTGRIAAGRHALGIMLGNGMYNVQHSAGRYTKFAGSFGEPKLTAELVLRYRRGRTQIIKTDGSWAVSRGPVIFSSTYGGEDFDARRVQVGWDHAGFKAGKNWEPARLVEGPGGILAAAIEPDVASDRKYNVVKQTMPAPGKVVYDFGQNFAGVVRIRVQGQSGVALKLIPGELLNPDGTVSQASSGRGMWWTYTLRGGAEEYWHPQFGYYGFRYVQAEWALPQNATQDVEPRIIEIVGEQLHSASVSVGSFASSSELLNRIHALIVNAMHNNEVSLLTDCPHREKLGWLEQTHLVASGLLFNDDLEALYRETDRNMADAQDASGSVPTIAPQYTKFGPKYAIFDDSPEWGSAVVLAPWAAYRFYGDKAELGRSYPHMQAWVRYLQSRAVNGIVEYGLGDWYDIGPGAPGVSKNTSAGVTGTLMLFECAQAMQRIAELLGKAADAAAYSTLSQQAAASFQARFWDAQHRWYDHGSQTANAMPLALGIVPQGDRAAVLSHVIADIDAHDDHVTTGEVGYPYLLRALTNAGRDDVVLAMLLRKDPPSYGAQLDAGATSLTEAWDANRRSSQDHFMLGGAEEWFYRSLAGIDFDLSRSDALVIRPAIIKDISWARATYRSHLGEIRSEWHVRGGDLIADITVPKGLQATVILPSVGELRVGSRLATQAAGVTLESRTNGVERLRIQSGTYHFLSQLADR